ncbi:MAG: prepilin-type N-terminal cleavage/methylation domain-containing protein, partial [Thiotrichales bacterium]|nr:prepilin-type N-terminal cleavage/methylation domain-containing protein [Thiotrichales bacterium]
MKMKQAGFTLIELVVVITILGILAAFALPRFANVESQARTASIEGLAGGLRAATALAHSQWLVDGATTGNVTIVMEGTNVDLVDGWPDASTT